MTFRMLHIPTLQDPRRPLQLPTLDHRLFASLQPSANPARRMLSRRKVVFVLAWMFLNQMPWIEVGHLTGSVEEDVLYNVDLVFLQIVLTSRGNRSFLHDSVFSVYTHSDCIVIFSTRIIACLLVVFLHQPIFRERNLFQL